MDYDYRRLTEARRARFEAVVDLLVLAAIIVAASVILAVRAWL